MEFIGPELSSYALTSPPLIGREMALAADLALWAGDEERCVEIIERLYELLDEADQGLAPNWHSRIVAAEAATWVGNHDRYALLTNHDLG